MKARASKVNFQMNELACLKLKGQTKSESNISPHVDKYIRIFSNHITEDELGGHVDDSSVSHAPKAEAATSLNKSK